MRKRTIAAFLLLLAMLLCACSPISPDPSETERSGSTEERSPLTLPIGTAAVFDPLTSQSALDLALAPLICESLYARNEKGTCKALLAESYRRTEDAVQIVLRKGQKFHSGSALSAEDVVFSFERAQSAPQGAFRDALSVFDSAVALDTRTVEFRLSGAAKSVFFSPEPHLLFPIQRAGTGITADAEGTGPYRLVRQGKDPVLIAMRKGLSYEKVALCRIRDVDALCEALEHRSVDAAAVDVLSTRTFTPIGDFATQSVSSGICDLLIFNRRNGALRDERLRRAISCLLPRQKLCREALFSAANADSSFLPASVADLSMPRELTVDSATDTLTALGITKDTPLSLTLLYEDDLWQRGAFARAVAEELSAHSISCTLQGLQGEAYTRAVEKGAFDLMLCRRALTGPEELSELLAEPYIASDESLSSLTVFCTTAGDTHTESIRDLRSDLWQTVPFTVIGRENLRIYFRSDRITGFTPAPGSPYGDPAHWR